MKLRKRAIALILLIAAAATLYGNSIQQDINELREQSAHALEEVMNEKE